jgi:hypothetical protein
LTKWHIDKIIIVDEIVNLQMASILNGKVKFKVDGVEFG